MDPERLDHERVPLSAIVKRGIAVADANIIFIGFYFAVNFLTWLGFHQVKSAFVGTETPPDMQRLILFDAVRIAVLIPIQAFIDSLIGALLRRQLLSGESDSEVRLLGWAKRFYFRMLVINVAHGIAVILLFPLDSAIYPFLRYVAAFVVWQDRDVRTAFSGTGNFISVHSGIFLPVWFVGTAALLGANVAVRAPASSNPVFMGLLHLVLAYFDFAIVATAVISFMMLRSRPQEAIV